MDKFYLKWNGYNESIREYFRKLKEDEKLFDVTLVTDDGLHKQAHKIILSAGSNFFRDIFMKSDHSNMLVYLKGISNDKLEPVIDFIYKGEVYITQEQLNVFLETGKELQVNGFDSGMTGLGENTVETPRCPEEMENYDDKKVSIEPSGDDIVDTVGNMDEDNLQQRFRRDLSFQINEMIEKNEGVWRCKICGKTALSRQSTQRHAETHIEGMSHACTICGKTFTSTHRLTTHISGIHSELFSCDLCEKNRNEPKIIQSSQTNTA